MRTPFSERERGPKARLSEILDDRTWGGIVVLIRKLVEDGSLGAGFPSQCPDGRGIDGCNEHRLEVALRAEVDIGWPLMPDEVPADQFAILDLLEFVYVHVGKPIEGSWHDYYSHSHLSFDIPAGQAAFAEEVNHLFARNGIALEMTASGEIRRLLALQETTLLAGAAFHTSDLETDRLLEASRRAITSRVLEVRRDGLEKLWDAFERMKTLEPGRDKRASAEALLDRVKGGPAFRSLLAAEAKAMTDAGNTFRIRHSEVHQEIPQTANQVDYLFFRMFGFVRLLLQSTGRGA